MLPPGDADNSPGQARRRSRQPVFRYSQWHQIHRVSISNGSLRWTKQ